MRIEPSKLSRNSCDKKATILSTSTNILAGEESVSHPNSREILTTKATLLATLSNIPTKREIVFATDNSVLARKGDILATRQNIVLAKSSQYLAKSHQNLVISRQNPMKASKTAILSSNSTGKSLGSHKIGPKSPQTSHKASRPCQNIGKTHTNIKGAKTFLQKVQKYPPWKPIRRTNCNFRKTPNDRIHNVGILQKDSLRRLGIIIHDPEATKARQSTRCRGSQGRNWKRESTVVFRQCGVGNFGTQGSWCTS